MQNFSHKNKDDGPDDSRQNVVRQKNALQRDIVMLEADFKKLNNEKIQLESEIRGLKKEDARIKVDLQEKQAYLGKVTFNLTQIEVDLKNLKKKLNLIN